MKYLREFSEQKNMLDYEKYLRGVLKDIQIYKNSNSPQHKINYIFKDFYAGYCSLQRFGAIFGDEWGDLINEIYKEVFGHTRDEILDIAKRISMDGAKSRGLGHSNFEPSTTDEERKIYSDYSKVVHSDLD